jgi:hypothetical protein
MYLYQDRQCAYNIRLRRDHVTIDARPKQKELNILFVALFIQHEQRMRHNILLSVACSNFRIFPNYLIKGTIFGKRFLKMKCAFESLLIWIFLNKIKNSARYDQNIYCSACTVPSILVRFNKTWIFWTDFRKILKMKFHVNSFSGVRLVLYGRTDGRTDGNDEVNSWSQFWEERNTHRPCSLWGAKRWKKKLIT